MTVRIVQPDYLQVNVSGGCGRSQICELTNPNIGNVLACGGCLNVDDVTGYIFKYMIIKCDVI